VVDLDYNLAQLSDKADILNNPRASDERNHAIIQDLLGKIIWWPLLAACSMVRRHPHANFNEEFLFPHLFMEYISEHSDYHGVRYFSCRESIRINSSRPLLINYAIPARTLGADEYCPELSSRFDLTSPLSWQLLSVVDHASAEEGTPGFNWQCSVGLAGDHSISYTSTDFHRMGRLTYGHQLRQTIGPVLS
jgi:hypothetical protein